MLFRSLVENISPEARVGYERLVIDGRETSTYVTGVTADYLPVAKRWVEPDQGRFVSDLDVLNMNDVIVLGSAVVPELFAPNENPVGKVVKIRGRRFGVQDHAAIRPVIPGNAELAVNCRQPGRQWLRQAHLRSHPQPPCSASQRSASIAAAQPMPAAVMAWR